MSLQDARNAAVEKLLSRRRLSPLELLPWVIALGVYFFLPQYLTLGSQILIMVLFALSLDITLGYAGVIILGHAAFYGMGAYTAGLLAVHGWGDPLIGLVAAAMLGYRRGSCVIDITRAQLEAIIEMLAPAEACTEVPHPNLWLWRDTFLPALDVDPDARLVAVFIETLDAPLDGPEADAFRVALETPSTL